MHHLLIIMSFALTACPGAKDQKNAATLASDAKIVPMPDYLSAKCKKSMCEIGYKGEFNTSKGTCLTDARKACEGMGGFLTKNKVCDFSKIKATIGDPDEQTHIISSEDSLPDKEKCGFEFCIGNHGKYRVNSAGEYSCLMNPDGSGE
jgi:hypothetical protein